MTRHRTRLPRRVAVLGAGAVIALGLAFPRTTRSLPEGIPCAPEPTDMRITYGDAITCALESTGDSDVFRFLGTAGETVMLFTGGSARPCLEVTAPGGKQQTACSFGNFSERLDLTLVETGTYTVRITGVFDSTYTVVLERVSPPSRDRIPIQYGATLDGDLDPEYDFDLFVFRGGAGDSITIEANGNVRPCIELVTPDDSRQVACDFGAFSQRIDRVLTQEGTYAVLYSGVFTGAYTLSLQCLVGPCVPTPAACLTNAECDDGNACTADACSPGEPSADAIGCIHAAVPASACDDADACTVDSCEPVAGCTHVRDAGCTGGDPASQCSGLPDFTSCGTPVGSCRLACRGDRCASELVCEQTTATTTPRRRPTIAVSCEGSGGDTEEFCAAQGFVEVPGRQPRPLSPASVSARLVKVTKKLRRRIDPVTKTISFELRLNGYGKRLLKRARKRRERLVVTLQIVLETPPQTSAVLRDVAL